MSFLLWIEETGLAVFIREDLWGYPIVLSSHAVGMATVMGVVVVLNMRALGFASQIPVPSIQKLFPVAWLGFALNLLSGLALYSASAATYTLQGSFQLKIGLIVLGGISLKLLMNGIRAGKAASQTKLIAALSLACWFGAIITGRLMAYI